MQRTIIQKELQKLIKKDLAEKLDFKDIKIPVKVRDIYKVEKIILSTLVFLVMKIRKNIQSVYQKIVVKKKMLIIDRKRSK